MSSILTIFLPMLTCAIDVVVILALLEQRIKTAAIIWAVLLNCSCALVFLWCNISNDWRHLMLVSVAIVALASFGSYYGKSVARKKSKTDGGRK